jgi:hypothetical protein
MFPSRGPTGRRKPGRQHSPGTTGFPAISPSCEPHYNSTAVSPRFQIQPNELYTRSRRREVVELDENDDIHSWEASISRVSLPIRVPADELLREESGPRSIRTHGPLSTTLDDPLQPSRPQSLWPSIPAGCFISHAINFVPPRAPVHGPRRRSIMRKDKGD